MKLKTIVRAIALLGVAGPALAQPAAPATQRVEITGSSIKQRLSVQGALPVQVIRGEDLQQQGIVTAEALVNSLGVNSANVDNATSRNNVFGAEQDRLTGGSSFANLRGLGPTGTLVLLNGRRVSTHGTSGGAVDLNAIPLAAVERVEILTDGASAIYGTDAIGGVINFILKTDYRGVSLSATLSQPLASGGGTTRRVSVTGGHGALDREGFNLMASLTADKNDILRGIERDWATGFQPERGLTPDTTSAPHANIIGFAGSALPTTGSTVGTGDATKYTNLNLLAMQGKCDQSPFGVPLSFNPQFWDKSGYTNANSRYRCATDYGRQFMLLAPKESLNLVSRGTFRLGAAHTGFIELVGSRTDVLAEFTPYQFSTGTNARVPGATAGSVVTTSTLYPVNGPHYLNLKDQGANDFDPTKPIAYRLRMWDWGYRTLENSSENLRLATGLDGEIGRYNYKLGLSTGQAKGWSTMVDGYAYAQKLIAALAGGKINPFLMPGQSQTAEAQALIESTKARGRLFAGKTKLLQADGTISGELYTLPAGTVDFALGFDLRRESYQFSGTQGFTCVSLMNSVGAELADAVMGCPGNAASPDRSRDVRAVFAELQVPVTSQLQLTLQVRHDNYSGVGSTTNPKLAFRFQPLDSLVLRGSANTGFRAPTVQQLYLGTQELALTGTFSDPERCPSDASQCNRTSLPYRAGGNPTLKPETSTQGSLGVAFQPTPTLQMSADYWQVKLDDRIRSLSPAFMITNYSLFRDSFIRDSAGNVSYIQAGWVNAAESETKGLDFGITHNMPALDGRLTGTLTGTKMLSHKERLIPTLPMIDYVGEWTGTTLYLPWKLNASLGLKRGDWNTTLSMAYKSGYWDEDMAAYDNSPLPRRKVSPYTTFNLFTTYKGIKNLTLNAGVLNLFDKQPPFTWHNVDGVIGAGWDPRVADPRGRTVSFTASYDFK